MDQFGHLSLCRVAKLDAAAHDHLTGGHSSHGSADAVAAAVAGDSAAVVESAAGVSSVPVRSPAIGDTISSVFSVFDRHSDVCVVHRVVCMYICMYVLVHSTYLILQPNVESGCGL